MHADTISSCSAKVPDAEAHEEAPVAHEKKAEAHDAHAEHEAHLKHVLTSCKTSLGLHCTLLVFSLC
jgi:hypothetical protein